MQYPRPGEPIVPRLLRPLVLDRRPVSRPDRDSELIAHGDLGREAWGRLLPKTCQRLSMVVVDRVQTRIPALPELTLDHPLPDPSAALALPLERRTANTIRRALRRPGGPWTVRRYLELPRFGGRALVDLLAAVEAHAPEPNVPAAEPEGLSDSRGDFASEQALDRALTLIAQRLPLSEAQAQRLLASAGFGVDGAMDLSRLAHTAVRHGRHAPFHLIDVGGSRMLIRLSEVTAALTAYRVAVRMVQGWGAATIRTVVAHLRVAADGIVGPEFVERLLAGVSSFRWLDRSTGWFWFPKAHNPLLKDAQKIFSVATRLSVTRMGAALFRARVGPRPSAEAVHRICAELPGARLAGQTVSIARPFDRGSLLSGAENRVTRLLEPARQGLSAAEVRGRVRALGMPWTTVLRLLRCSPLIERSPSGLYRLVGSPG